MPQRCSQFRYQPSVMWPSSAPFYACVQSRADEVQMHSVLMWLLEASMSGAGWDAEHALYRACNKIGWNIRGGLVHDCSSSLINLKPHSNHSQPPAPETPCSETRKRVQQTSISLLARLQPRAPQPPLQLVRDTALLHLFIPRRRLRRRRLN
jgi:hypothetical protein